MLSLPSHSLPPLPACLPARLPGCHPLWGLVQKEQRACGGAGQVGGLRHVCVAVKGTFVTGDPHEPPRDAESLVDSGGRKTAG